MKLGTTYVPEFDRSFHLVHYLVLDSIFLGQTDDPVLSGSDVRATNIQILEGWVLQSNLVIIITTKLGSYKALLNHIPRGISKRSWSLGHNNSFLPSQLPAK